MLDKYVNIVPVIAKSDTMTLEERETFKKRVCLYLKGLTSNCIVVYTQIREDIEFHGIRIYPSAYGAEDEDDASSNNKIDVSIY